MEKILIVDDDEELCALVMRYLKSEGFEAEAVHNGSQGAEKALTGDYVLLVLDVMLPGSNGFDVLRHVRRESAMPVLMLTARGDDIDRIVGLEIGADDYLPKPFNPRELVARIRAILRRSQAPRTVEPENQSTQLHIGDITLDSAARSVRRNNEIVDLTGAEFDLLAILLRNAGQVVTREELVKQVLGRPLTPLDRSIDTLVSNLRRKIGPTSDGLERIKSLRGIGYVYTRRSEEK